MHSDIIKYIPEDKAREITAKANILDVIKDLTGNEVKKAGANYKALCPFHEDHTPSLMINTNKNYCSCFACSLTAMHPIDFIARFNNWDAHADYIKILTYIADLYNIDIPEDDGKEERQKVRNARKVEKKAQEPKPINYGAIPSGEVQKYRSNSSIFAKFLYNVFDADKVNAALQMYNVGTIDTDNKALFWYIDVNGVCREGKKVKYKYDGHRDHATDIKALAKYTYSIQDVKPCLFGENLLHGWNSTIAITEAEKTAVIMSIMQPSLLWLSCGGESNLTETKCQALKGRKVLIFPDADGLDNWSRKVETMQKAGIDAQINTKWMAYAVPEDGPKYDIADIYVRLMQTRNRMKTQEETDRRNNLLMGVNNSLAYQIMNDNAAKLNGMPF